MKDPTKTWKQRINLNKGKHMTKGVDKKKNLGKKTQNACFARNLIFSVFNFVQV